MASTRLELFSGEVCWLISFWSIQRKTPHSHPHFSFPPGWYPFPQTLVYGADHGAVCGAHYCTLCEESLIIVVMKTPALQLRITDFQGQVMVSFMNLLGAYNIHVCLLPLKHNLQPMIFCVNKLAQVFVKRRFNQRYLEQVLTQLEGEDTYDLEALKTTANQPWLPSPKGNWSKVAGGHGNLHQQ